MDHEPTVPISDRTGRVFSVSWGHRLLARRLKTDIGEDLKLNDQPRQDASLRKQ